MDWLEDTTIDGVRRREFDLEANGRVVSGVLWEGAGAGKPMVCFGHGASGDRHQRPIPHLAKRLATEHGYYCLAIDGPVHGRRQVGPGGREAFGPEWRREDTVDDMTADWQAVIDAIHPEVGNGPIGYWGLSMGTVYGAPLLAAEPRISAAVLGLTGIIGPGHFKTQLKKAARRITCPVFFIQQLEDEIVEREAALAFFDALASEDKRLHANPGLHPQVPPEELDFSVAFLTGYLSGDGLSREAIFSISE